MLRNFLPLLTLIVLCSCTQNSSFSHSAATGSYAAYLENDSLRLAAKKAGDTEGTKASWDRNTTLLKEELPDTLRLALIRQRMSISRQLFPIDSTIAIAHNYEALAEATEDSSTLADAWFRLAYYYEKARRIDKFENYTYKAMNLAKEIGDTLVYAKTSINLGNRLNDIQNFVASQKIGSEALAMDPPTAQKTKLLNILAEASGGQENFENKIYWLEEALTLNESLIRKNPTTERLLNHATLKNNLAMGYYRMGEKRIALGLLDALEKDTIWTPNNLSRTKSNTIDYARILYNLALVKYSLEIEGPKELIDRSEALLKSVDAKAELSRLYLQKAQYYKNNLPISRKLALQSIALSRETSQTSNLLEGLKLLTETSRQPKAYALEYQKLNDSINTALNNARDAFARYQYDVDRTREVNKQLKAESTIQKLEIRDSRIRTAFLAIILIILLGASSLRYRLMRVRARLRQAEEVNKTESAIAKRIHDELANDLYNTISFAELNKLDTPEQKNQLLNNLEDIYKRTRNVSRENAGLPKGSEFGEAVSSLISHYRSKQTNILVRGLNEIQWEKLEDYRQQTLYRVLQELLVNMRKHSGATLVVISFSQQGKKLEVGYKDNGKGLPGNKIPGGGGIKNMESRLEQTGGRFKLQSAEGKGVNVAMIYG